MTTLGEFYARYYPTAKISICSSSESEMMKLFCNSFYASKIQILTEYYLLCQQMGIEFDTVRDLMLKNDWINPKHTDIPGPDGQLGAGGHCFPKDVNNLRSFARSLDTGETLFTAVLERNDELRENKDWLAMKGRAVVEEYKENSDGPGRDDLLTGDDGDVPPSDS